MTAYEGKLALDKAVTKGRERACASWTIRIMRRECLRAAAVNVVSSQTSPEEGTPDQRQLLTSATPIHERHESLSGGSAVVMEGKECRSLSAKARFHVRQQATPSIVRDKAVFISSQLCARAPHSHHTPFPSRTSTSSKQSDKLARHQRFGVQPPWMATPPAAKASGLSESPVHDSLPGFDDSVNDGSQNENDKKRNSNVSYAQIRRDNATGSNGGPFNVPHSTSNESSSMHTALFAPNTLQRTVSTASKASKTSRASKSSISSASNKRPGNKDRPTSVVPPYWQQMRHNSRASIASFAGQGITLEDNSDRYEDYNDETASGPKSPLWARQIDIAEFVKIEGDIKGVGGYVVWLVRVETLDGGKMMIRKRYSQFEALREQLVATFPSAGSSLPALPTKSVFYKYLPSFLEKRRVGLAYFLNCVLLNPEFSGSPAVRDFIFDSM